MNGIQTIISQNQHAAQYELNQTLKAAKNAGKSYAQALDALGNIDINAVPYVFDTQAELKAFALKQGVQAISKFQLYWGTEL